MTRLRENRGALSYIKRSVSASGFPQTSLSAREVEPRILHELQAVQRKMFGTQADRFSTERIQVVKLCPGMPNMRSILILRMPAFLAFSAEATASSGL